MPQGWTPVSAAPASSASPAGGASASGDTSAWTPVDPNAGAPPGPKRVLAATQPPPAPSSGLPTRLFGPKVGGAIENDALYQNVRNIASPSHLEMAGAVAGGMAAPELLPVEGLLEAGVGAAGAAAGGAAGQTVSGHPEEAIPAAKRQATYELAGRGLMGAMGWPLRKMLGSRVATETGEALQTGLQKAQDLYDTTKAGAADFLAKTKEGAGKAVDAATAKVRELGDTLSATRDQAASELSRARVSQQGLKNLHANTPPPSTAAIETAQATQRGAKAAFQGPPPTVEASHIPTPTQAGRAVNAAVQGPGRASLNKIGQQVEEAARSGPDVDFRPVKEKVQQMVEASRPSTMAEQPELEGPGGAVASAVLKSGSPASQEAFQKALTDAGVVMQPSHPAPGVLKTIADAPDTVSFADAHKYKRMLDDAVSWDKQSKTQLGQMTKGARQSIREQMAGHAPYEEATQAYAAAAPLFSNRSIAGQLQRNALDNPGIVIRDVKGNEPVKLQMLFDILDTHAANGGGAAAGQHAKDALRSAWTYKNLIAPGIDKFGANAAKMEPEFVQTMYGDEAGKEVLGNLNAIHDAYQKAVADEATATTAHKTAVETQKATQAAQTRAAADRIVTTKAKGDAAVRAAQEPLTAAQGTLAETKAQAKRATELAKSQGEQTTRAARTKLGIARGEQQAFKASSIGPPKSAADTAVNLFHAIKEPTSFFAIGSIKDLARAPKMNDLVEWSSRSSARTKQLVDALNSPYPTAAITTLMRVAGLGISDKGVSSHSGPPPGPAATAAPPAPR